MPKLDTTLHLNMLRAGKRRRKLTARILKAIKVLRLGSAVKQTSPPLPPLPPLGPPRGSYFSRRKLTQPSPPLPPWTYILASSKNIGSLTLNLRIDARIHANSCSVKISMALDYFRKWVYTSLLCDG